MFDLLKKASEAYYKGEPIMTDEEFDALASEFNEVGHEPSSKKVKHPYQMWSLQKVYTDENVPNLSIDEYQTVKLDGAALRLSYSISLIQAATRGNGKEGQDVTDLLYGHRCVPATLPGTNELQIVGELVAPKHIKNARNYAAGALNLKSAEEFSSRDLIFVAYGIFPYQNKLWTEDMKLLQSWGFDTVIDRDWSKEYPADGFVIRIDSYEDFESRGYTAKFPRGAFALKERPSGVVTTLVDVEWQVGRSGIVSPVAILKPVLVGDATVSRATLHNMKYIEALNLDIGCQVEVIRSGEIIPRIIRRVD